MRRTSWIRMAVLAGAGLMWQTGGQAQQPYSSGDPTLQQYGGEVCPPLDAPSPYYRTPSPGEPMPAPGTSPSSPAPSSESLQNQQTPYAPTLNDFPQSPGQAPGMGADMSAMQPGFTPGMPAYGSTAATSPQSVAPNMIGDFFGVSQGSTLTLQTSAFHARGFFRERSTGDLSYFPASSNGSGNIVLTAPTAFDIIGESTGTIPSGSQWTSTSIYSPVLPYPSNFDLSENSDETAATQAAFPSASSVTFVEGEAVANPDSQMNDEFAIYTDYLVDGPSPVTTFIIPDPGSAPGAFVGRQKIGENTSPLPRTRAFVNYSYFESTPLTAGGLNVDRVTPGFEYAFWDDNLSIEVRAPFASTLSSDIYAGGRTNTSEIEFGNMAIYLKALMWESDTFSWSAGVGMTLPTADDVTYRDFDGTPLLRVENEAIHAMPFLGFLYTPSERLFMQGFLQFDVDTSGNPVELSSFNEGDPTGNLTRIGRADDSTYAFIDLGVGYWIYRNRHCDGFINGLAPIVEIHYNAATEGADTINRTITGATSRDGATVQVGRPGDLEVTNVVFGLNAVVGESGTLTLGYATPVAGDDQFDGEFRAFFNWFFGPKSSSYGNRRNIQF